MNVIEVVVYGQPRPAGALAIGVRKDGGRFLRHTGGSSLADWKNAIVTEAGQQVDEIIREAVAVSALFYVRRPASHYGKRGLKASAPAYPIKRSAGDVDKLARALLDALTGCAFVDDSQVIDLVVGKRFADDGPEHLLVKVRPLDDELDVLHEAAG